MYNYFLKMGVFDLVILDLSSFRMDKQQQFTEKAHFNPTLNFGSVLVAS